MSRPITGPVQRLDGRWLAYRNGLPHPDEYVEDALLAIGELLGGLSVNGFAADLRSHLARVEEELLADAGPRDYRAGLGSNDPDSYISGRLEDAIDAARAADAADWLHSAHAIMHRMTQPLPVAA